MESRHTAILNVSLTLNVQITSVALIKSVLIPVQTPVVKIVFAKQLITSQFVAVRRDSKVMLLLDVLKFWLNLNNQQDTHAIRTHVESIQNAKILMRIDTLALVSHPIEVILIRAVVNLSV